MRALIFLGILLTAGCDGVEEGVTETSDSAEESTVFDPLADTLETARGVEDTLRDSAAARRQQLEDAEGR